MSNTAPSGTSGSTTVRPQHPNTDEAEENDLKNNLIKMTEALKHEMKKYLKVMEEKE